MNSALNSRPTFITVLCILSFINGGVNILFNIPSLLMPNMMESYIDIIKQSQKINENNVQTPPFVTEMMNSVMEMLEHMAAHWTSMILSTILLAVMSVIGVWMMWGMKKSGFLFYCTAQILWTIMPFIFLGTNIFVGLAVVLNGIFTFAFIIMYGLQLKKMY